MSKNLLRSVIILGDCGYEFTHVKIILLAPIHMSSKRAAPERLAHEFTSKGGNADNHIEFAQWLEGKGFVRLHFQEKYFNTDTAQKRNLT